MLSTFNIGSPAVKLFPSRSPNSVLTLVISLSVRISYQAMETSGMRSVVALVSECPGPDDRLKLPPWALPEALRAVLTAVGCQSHLLSEVVPESGPAPPQAPCCEGLPCALTSQKACGIADAHLP